MNKIQVNMDPQKNFSFSAKAEKKIEVIMKKYPNDRQASAVMPLLDLAQREAGGWLPVSALETVADKVGLAYMRVLEIASFYTMYNLKPVGKWHLQLCGTTPCWLRGSDDILKAIFDTLKLKPNETSKNGEFTLTPVECLGACVNAPILQVNDDFYEDLDYESTKKLINSLIENKQPKFGSFKKRKSEPENGSTVLLSLKGKKNA
jgi:NADH-quinone oxidoreductase E subunit|tara:strand:- start:124 stop:738 length:615 start_codon:yes stop_codon:yes gene_type:complete